MKNIISISNLCFKYNKNDILKDITLNIESGTFLSIIGPNGSGKTTLLKNMVKILNPTNGSIKLYNSDLNEFKYKDLAKKVAVVHQNSNIAFNFSVKDIVMMGRFPYLKRFESESKIDYDMVEKAMKDTGIFDLRDRSAENISGGEMQRVMIARALVQQPEIMILDEPTSSLDLKYQVGILDICKQLNKSENITVICILHDINLAARYSDKIALLKNGEIFSLDIPQNVITSENIKKVYDVNVDIKKIDNTEIPYIIPRLSI